MNACGTPWPSLDTWINHIAITPDSAILIAACLDRTIRLWHLETSQPLCPPLKGHTNSVRCLAITPNATRLLSGADEGAIRVWNMNQPENALAVWTMAHRGAVRCLAISPDGRLAASAGDDGVVRLWSLVYDSEVGCPIKGHQNPISSLSFNAEGNLLISGDEGGCLTVWTFENNIPKVRLQLRIPNAIGISGITPLPGINEIVTSCTDSTVRKWDLNKGIQIGSPWKEHTDAVRCLALLKDKVVSGSSDTSIRVWEASDGKPVGDAWTGPTMPIETIAAAPNGKIVVSAGPGEMWTWLLA